ncbi:MAG TPA: hypothetical protein DCZ40_08755 [Lachnospiraceae bacterium]|nr:hypothetical protein [Lachnospiraceae bacterium]
MSQHFPHPPMLTFVRIFFLSVFILSAFKKVASSIYVLLAKNFHIGLLTPEPYKVKRMPDSSHFRLVRHPAFVFIVSDYTIP